MNSYRPLFFFIIFLLTSIVMYSQTTSRNQIKQMFDKTNEGLWISHYDGLFDQTFEVQLTMGLSGDQCRGILIYGEDKGKFSIEGYVENDKYFLEEFDEEHRHTGTLTLEKNRKQLVGNWESINKDQRYTIVLSKVNQTSKLDQKVFSNKYYSNKDQSVELEISRSLNQLFVKFYRHHQAIEWISYKVEKADQTINFIHDEVVYTITPLNQNKLLVKVNKDKNQENYHLDMVSKLNFESKVEVNYSSKGEIHYPVTDDEKFNSWIEEVVASIWSQQLTNLNENNISPHNRHEQEIFVKPIITHYSNDQISGLFLIENNGSRVVETITFNYSFRKNEAVEIEKYFDRDQYEEVIYKYKNIEREKNTLMKADLKKDWLMSSKYDHIVLAKNGIKLFTEFNKLYGHHSIFIPYGEIKDQLKVIPNSHFN